MTADPAIPLPGCLPSEAMAVGWRHQLRVWEGFSAKRSW